MLTCPIHHDWLEFHADPPGHYSPFPHLKPSPPNPAIIAMDLLTAQALAIGRAHLPGGTVPATTWVRLLRTLIAEQADQHNQRSYEALEPDEQEEALTAAAATIADLQTGKVTGRGNDVYLFQSPARQSRVHATTETSASDS